MNWEDPIVADVRRIREGLSAKFDFDLTAIFADIRPRQSSAGDRLARLKCDAKDKQSHPPKPAAGPAASGESSPPAR